MSTHTHTENLEGPVNRKLNASQNKEPFKGSSDDGMKTQQSKGINSEIRVCYYPRLSWTAVPKYVSTQTWFI